MNCQFCQKECQTVSENCYRCIPCSTDYHPHATCIYTSLGEKAYTVKLYKKGPVKMAISSAYQDPMIELAHDGNITPQNIKDKLKTLLTFS